MIGALRHQITLLKRAETPDAGGGASLAWAPAARYWARIDRLASTRDFLGDRRRRLRRVAATLRAQTHAKIGDRLSFSGETYEIVSIESASDDHRQHTLIGEEALDA